MNVLDLFSGIGGFSLGLERASMRTVAFCEIDPYCQRVLRRHWPDVPIFGDVRNVAVHEGWLVDDTQPGRELAQGEVCARRERIATSGIDVICGGFPCTDISVAGKGAGITGPQSGLWSEYARIIGEVRPRYVIVENVAALLGRGIERVLGDLAALGFDAEWHCIPASAVGAPHRRDRVWIVAHARQFPQSKPQHQASSVASNGQARLEPRVSGWGQSVGTAVSDVADANRADGQGIGPERHSVRPAGLCGRTWGDEEQGLALTEGSGCGAWWTRRPFGVGAWIREFALSDSDSEQAGRPAIAWGERDHWLTEPDVGRVAHGVPARVDRLRALGNAIVPQIPELIGRAIMQQEGEQ